MSSVTIKKWLADVVCDVCVCVCGGGGCMHVCVRARAHV